MLRDGEKKQKQKTKSGPSAPLNHPTDEDLSAGTPEKNASLRMTILWGGEIITERNLRCACTIPPHPGEVIREYLGEMSVSAAAEHFDVSRVALSRVLNGKAAV